MPSRTATYTPTQEKTEDDILALLRRHAARVGHFRDYNDAVRAADHGNTERMRDILASIPVETSRQRRAFETEADAVRKARLLIARRGQFHPEK